MKVKLEVPDLDNQVLRATWQWYDSEFVPRAGDYVEVPTPDGSLELEVRVTCWVPKPDDGSDPYVLVVLKP